MKTLRGRWGLLAILVIAVWLLGSVTQVGAETLKGRTVYFTTKAEVLKIEDVPDHIIGLYEHTGLVSFEMGEVASFMLKGTFDYIKGSGPHEGYTRDTFEDGSTIDFKHQGTTRPDPSGKGSLFEGTITVLQGTGRWAGIQGKGTCTGRRFVPFGAGAQLYTDFTLTYTLPGR